MRKHRLTSYSRATFSQCTQSVERILQEGRLRQTNGLRAWLGDTLKFFFFCISQVKLSIQISLFPVYVQLFPVQRLRHEGVSCFVHQISEMTRRYAGIYLANLQWFVIWYEKMLLSKAAQLQHFLLFKFRQLQRESKSWQCLCSAVALSFCFFCAIQLLYCSHNTFRSRTLFFIYVPHCTADYGCVNGTVMW